MERQGHRLMQLGMTLFFLALALGFAIPRFAVPRLALSAHLLGIMQGLFLCVAGLLWPRLALGRATSRVALGLATYGCLAAWSSNVLSAALGGHPLLPMASGGASSGSGLEAVVTVLLRSGGAALLASVLLILWGLRAAPAKE